MKQFNLLNGDYVPKDEALFSAAHRCFRHCDALVENLHANGGRVSFLDAHLANITQGMRLLNMDVPEKFLAPELLQDEIGRLLHRNRLFQGARVTLTVFRKNGLEYLPVNNQISYLLETDYLSKGKYEINEKGLKINVFDQLYKVRDKVANLRTTNSLIRIMADMHRVKYKLDECLLINDKGAYTESIWSNLFVLEDGAASTPSLDEGVTKDIMQDVVKDILTEMGYTVFYSPNIKEYVMSKAEEVFLVDCINGVRWVSGFREKRFYNKISKNIVERLNARL